MAHRLSWGGSLLFQSFAVMFSELLHLRRDDCHAVACIGILFIVFLMIVLGLVKGLVRLKLGDDRVLKNAFSIQTLDHSLGGRLLLWAVEEDQRSILGPRHLHLADSALWGRARCRTRPGVPQI